MHKLFLVAKREFLQRVRSRGFIIGSLAVPLIMMVVWGATGLLGGGVQESPVEELNLEASQEIPIGYVDQAGLIQSIPAPLDEGQFRRCEDESVCRSALEAGEIEAYHVIPADYRQTGDVRRVSHDLPFVPADTGSIDWILVANLFPQAHRAQIQRLNWPFDQTGPEFVSVAPRSEETAVSDTFLPFLVTVVVMIPLFTSGGYLLQSITQEKSNQVIEVLLVSLRPWHLLGGKLIGLGGLTLVQYAIWGLIGGLALLVTDRDSVNLLQGINLSIAEFLLVVPYALGGFILYAGLMAGIGALSPDMEGSRGWVFLISLPMMIPIYLWTAIVNAPNGWMATALSMIPFSAPVAMLMRMTSTLVPAWQLVTSLILLLLTGVAIMWLMGRLFRVQTLLSGEKPSISRFVSAVSGG